MPTPKHVTNLSNDEKTALQELISDDNIIVKEADEGGDNGQNILQNRGITIRYKQLCVS